ncbi:MAG: transposase [Anaerolineae bacterium]|nr:transposase [Anaerolineae bacterium]
MQRIDVRIVYLVLAERNYDCPECGCAAGRHDVGQRLLADVDCDGPVFVHVTMGVYRCGECGSSFRHPLSFARPGYLYTERVVRKCVESVVVDGMPFCRVPGRMRRDFFVSPSEKSVRRWVLRAAAWAGVGFSNAVVVKSFTGKLAVDGVYEGKRAALVLLDAETGEELHLELEVTEDSKTLTQVFERLKAAGWAPEVVVMDEGPGLSKAVGEVFPEAEQAICRWHVLRRMRKRVRMGFKEYGESLSPQTAKRRRKRGRPPKAERGPEDRGKPFRSRKVRDVLLRHPGRLSAEERAERERLLREHPQMRQLVWAYLVLWRGLSGRGDLKKIVAGLRARLGDVEGQLRTIIERFTDELVEKLLVYKKHKGLDGTNNVCERWARGYRKRQKIHYRLRSPEMRRAVLGLEEMVRRQRLGVRAVRASDGNGDGSDVTQPHRMAA